MTGRNPHPPKVAAVVVNYNARDHLVTCVRSLQEGGAAPVIIADNASSDGSREAVDAAALDVRWVDTGGNLGFGRGANAGARLAPDAHDLLVANPDVVVVAGAVEALAAALDADPGLAIVGARIENTDGTVYPSPRSFPSMGDAVGHAFLGLMAPANRFTRRYRMLDVDRSAASSDVDWVSGSCFLVRRSAWDALGGFDEAYFMYAEDVDLCWRARRAGWRVGFEPAARVVHVQGVSTDHHPYRMIAEHHRSLLRFASRSMSGWRRAFLPFVALGLVTRVPLAWAHRALRGRRRP